MTVDLSQFDRAQLPSPELVAPMHIGIAVADWNSDITHALLDGAVKTLQELGVKEENIHVVHVPGTVELTYAAAKMMDADYDFSYRFNAIIVIGCVIQGETPHFDYVCQSVTNGVTLLNSRGRIPVIFSVLTTLNKQQALDRAGGKLGNKGVEGAVTALRMSTIEA